MLAKHWDEKSGDKRQEIVFIGFKDTMDINAIKAELDQCLIQDYWQDQAKYHALHDPFPNWFKTEHEMET